MDPQTTQTLDKYAQNKYKYGFVTDIDSDRPKKGLNEEIIGSGIISFNLKNGFSIR